MKFTPEEQETVIIYNAKEKIWEVYSSVPAHITFFTSKTSTVMRDFKIGTSHQGKPTSIQFKTDKEAIAVQKIFSKKRNLSPEQRSKLAERFKNSHQDS